MIPYGRQEISEDDIAAVVKVLRSDFLTQGPKGKEFENLVASKVSASFGVAVNSATSALHIACLALGLREGDWLWTSPITFVASANAGLYCGANIDFVDIDPHTFNLCPNALEKKLVAAKKEDRLPKIVIPVHLCGQSCDMEAIYKLSVKYGFKIIEDASHAVGGKYLNEYIGNCRFSDVTVFSFHPVKIITTAEGGMAVTNSEEIKNSMELLRTHGITRDENIMTELSHGPWYYQQIKLGMNYRMNDLQAALGINQLKRLDYFVSKRQEIARRYDKLLEGSGLLLPFQSDNGMSAYHLYVVRVDFDKTNKKRYEVFSHLRSKSIGVNVHYIPVHLQPYFQEMGFREGDFPKAEKYYSEAISLPIYPNLTEEDQEKVVRALWDLLGAK